MKQINYTSCVQASVYVEPSKRDGFLKLISELSGGKVIPRENEAECLEIRI